MCPGTLEAEGLAVTIKQISELCGVSRGTVDRVLNHRGKVKPETERKIRRMAEQLGYTPNMAGKALAARKRELVVGVALVSEGNAFFDEVLCGIQKAEAELKDYGVRVLVRTTKGYDVGRQLALLEELAEEANAVILNPINDAQIARRIDSLVEEGICVITVNTDIEGTRRLCYVGSDYISSGETACGMMGLLTGGRAEIGVVTGSVKVLGHNQRITGFRNIMKKKYPQFHVADFAESNDDDEQAYEAAKGMLTEHPEIDALYLVAAGVAGVCRAAEELGRSEKLCIICFDSTPQIMAAIQHGEIRATICQQPFVQGYESVKAAYHFLVGGVKPREQFIVKNEIKIAENL